MRATWAKLPLEIATVPQLCGRGGLLQTKAIGCPLRSEAVTKSRLQLSFLIWISLFSYVLKTYWVQGYIPTVVIPFALCCWYRG